MCGAERRRAGNGNFKVDFGFERSTQSMFHTVLQVQDERSIDFGFPLGGLWGGSPPGSCFGGCLGLNFMKIDARGRSLSLNDRFDDTEKCCIFIFVQGH